MKRVFIMLSFILCVNIAAFSQTLLLEPQSSVSVMKMYLGNGKFSDSISICTTFLYDTQVVKKYKTYITADLNNYLPINENVADWNCTKISQEDEELLKKQGIIFCDTVINDTKFANWYKVSFHSVTKKRTQAKQTINSGISRNKNVGKYKPIRNREDLQKALKNLTK